MPLLPIPPKPAPKIVDTNDVGFDVVLLAGQSNCVGYGQSNNQYLDTEDERIWQLCSWGFSFPLDGAQTTATVTSGSDQVVVASNSGISIGAQVLGDGIPTDTTVTAISGTTITLSKSATVSGTSVGMTFSPYRGRIIRAREPLEHFRKGGAGLVGPGLSFARLYVRTLKNNRRVLLVPTAYGSTGFFDNNWNPGNRFYNDAVAQVSLALQQPNSRFVGMIWVQGEQDAIRSMSGAAYTTAFTAMWNAMKSTITGGSTAWVVVGSMVPEWTFNNDAQVARARKIEIYDAHAALPGTIQKSWFVDGPTGLAATNNSGDTIHYNAAAQRTIGDTMFYEGYLSAIRNIDGVSPAAPSKFALNGNVTIGVRASWRAQFNVLYNVRWRVVGQTAWNTIANIQSPTVNIPADENTTIEAQVQAFRGGEIGDWSAVATATSNPTLLQNLLFRMTPSEIVTDSLNGAFPTSSSTGATYVSRWLDRSGSGRNFETVFHGSLRTVRTLTTTAGSTSATVASATNLFVGSAVYSTNVPYGTKITAISGTTITLSAQATGTGSGVSAEFFNPLTRNHTTNVTQPVGFGRPRYAVVDGIPCVAITNEWKSLWNKAGIVGNNSYSKTWLMKHAAVNSLAGQLNVANDGGTVALDTGSRNYTSCYVNTTATGADSTLTWRSSGLKINFSHNSLNNNALDTKDLVSNTWSIFTCTFNRTTGLLSLYRNGVLASTFTNTTALTSFAMYLGGIDLGPFRAGAVGACFAEVIAHDRALSADDALTLSEYMRSKYGVTLA
jgi:hypothetical protein